MRQTSKAVRLQGSWLAIALTFVASLPACFVPIQLPDKTLFDDEALAFIEIGRTTKEEIMTAMSDLAITNSEGESKTELLLKKFRGGDWWLYVQEREELAWLGLAPTGMGQIGDTDLRLLLVKFDASGVVTSYELSSSEGYGCNRKSVCVYGSSYALLAPEDEDRAVKKFDIGPGRCGIYVYGALKGHIGPVSIWIDGERLDSLLNREHFFFWQLDQGAHRLAAGGLTSEKVTSIAFNCDAEELYFFEFKEMFKAGFFENRNWIEINREDADAGRKAVSKRRLTLDATESVD